MNNFPYIPKPEARVFYAEVIYERIEEHIESAQSKASTDQDVFVFAVLSDGSRIPVDELGFHNPGFIVIYNKDEEGNKSEVIISHTNVQIIINTLNKSPQEPATQPRRIGFRGHV